MFLRLAFLLSHEISVAFAKIISVFPDEISGTEFSEYIFYNYILNGSQFPPNIRAEKPKFNPRYLYGFNKLFYSKINIIIFQFLFTNAVKIFHGTFQFLILQVISTFTLGDCEVIINWGWNNDQKLIYRE